MELQTFRFRTYSCMFIVWHSLGKYGDRQFTRYFEKEEHFVMHVISQFLLRDPLNSLYSLCACAFRNIFALYYCIIMENVESRRACYLGWVGDSSVLSGAMQNTIWCKRQNHQSWNVCCNQCSPICSVIEREVNYLLKTYF